MLKQVENKPHRPSFTGSVHDQAGSVLQRLLPSIHSRLVALFTIIISLLVFLSIVVVMRERALADRSLEAYVAGEQFAKSLEKILANSSVLSSKAPAMFVPGGFSMRQLPTNARSVTDFLDGQWRETPLSLAFERRAENGGGRTLHLRVLSKGGAFSIARLPARTQKLAKSDSSLPPPSFTSAMAGLSRYLADSLHEQRLAIRHDESWLVVDHALLWNNDRRFARYGWWFVLSLLGLVVLAPVVLRKVLSPLTELARDAARRKGREEFEHLTLHGVRETDQIAFEVNHLLEKSTHQLDDYTVFLAAISHDLATPVTRLRLRARLIEDDTLRDKFLRDCSQMSCMLKDALAFLRNEALNEEMRLVQFTSLLTSLCHDYQDAGKPVLFTEAPPLQYDTVSSLFHTEREHRTISFERTITAFVRPNAVRRALQNLIDNALNFGGTAQVGLNATSSNLTITIRDQGPGIPAHELEQVFKPFYRLDKARNMNADGNSQGSGLGLAIVQAIIDAHGGSIALENRSPGLRVTITLPRGIESE